MSINDAASETSSNYRNCYGLLRQSRAAQGSSFALGQAIHKTVILKARRFDTPSWEYATRRRRFDVGEIFWQENRE